MKRISLLVLLFLTTGLHTAFSQAKLATSDFYDSKNIQEVRITFKEKNWSYILDSLRFNGDGMLAGTVEAGGQKFEGAGIRFRGGKSFAPGALRNPLHIVLNYSNKDQNLQGYKVIKLSNALRDPSMVREVLGYEIARNYMPAPKANYAKVSINGEHYGLLVNVESVEEEAFLKRHFGSAGNAFFKANQASTEAKPDGCKNNVFGSLEYDNLPLCYEKNFEKLAAHGTNDLMELARIFNEEPGKIETVLNVDATLWMLAFNNVVVNLSSYSGQHSVNYYLYQDDQNRFTPIIWDLNLAFGSFKNIGGGSDLKLKALQELDPLLHASNPAKPLISKLLANEAYRKTYLSHLRSILYDWFVNTKYGQRAKELQNLIRKDVTADNRKGYTLEEFNASLASTSGKKSKIPGIAELMGKRTLFLKSHTALAIFPPDITEIKVATRTPLSSKRVETFQITAKVDKFPKRVVLSYRLDGKGDFRETLMFDEGRHGDGTAGDGVFGAVIVPQNGEQTIEYYIMAENAGLVSYSPAAYMWEKHTTTLEALNK
ncbi:MAG: CotH kinase family protein [Bacteroidota bacterium]